MFNQLTPGILISRVDEFLALAHNNISDEYWQQKHFLAPLKSKWELSFFLTQSDDPKIIGYVIASEKDKTVHIHKFIIDSEYQGKGLGKAMFHHILSRCDKPLSLKVNRENRNAISFYKNIGFTMEDTSNENFSMIYKRG